MKLQEPKAVLTPHYNSGSGSDGEAQRHFTPSNSGARIRPKIVSKKFPDVFRDIATWNSKGNDDTPSDVGHFSHRNHSGNKLSRDAEEKPSFIVAGKLSKEKKSHSNNPLLPYKHYLQQIHKVSEHEGPTNHSVIQRETPPSNVRRHVMVRGKVTPMQLNEMITISVFRGGSFKKVLHAPTFKMYGLREVPLFQKDMINTLKKTIGMWQTRAESSARLTKIYDSFWNTPEGCTSILMELMSGGSLENLLEHVYTLPEPALRQLSRQLFESLEEIPEIFAIPTGTITSNDILFDKNGNVKLSFGVWLKQDLKARPQSVGGHHISGHSRSMREPLMMIGGGMGYLIATLTEPFQTKRMHHYPKHCNAIGLVLLTSAIGDLEPYKLCEKLEDEVYRVGFLKYIKESLSSIGTYTRPCCFLHACNSLKRIRDNLNKVLKDKPSTLLKSYKETLELIISTHEYVTRSLAHYTSLEFVDFLCGLLRFDPQDVPLVSSLINHPFLKRETALPDTQGAEVSLGELVRLANSGVKYGTLPNGVDGACRKELDRICEQLSVVLPTCDNWFGTRNKTYLEDLVSMLETSDRLIDDLASEFGLLAKDVKRKIENTLKIIQKC